MRRARRRADESEATARERFGESALRLEEEVLDPLRAPSSGDDVGASGEGGIYVQPKTVLPADRSDGRHRVDGGD